MRRKLVLLCGSIVVVLLVAEISLRLLGFRPGIFRKTQGFTVVDSLILYENFTTDEAGIYKFSRWVTDSFPKYLNPQKGELVSNRVKGALYPVDKIDYIYQSFWRLRDSTSFNTWRWKLQRFFAHEGRNPFVETYWKIVNHPPASS